MNTLIIAVFNFMFPTLKSNANYFKNQKTIIMNKLFTILTILLSLNLFAQSTVEVVTGADYANENHYSFELEEVNSSPRNNWDVAFVTDNFDVNVQANNGAGVMVYTYPNGDITAWDNIDTTGINAWPAMYNSIEDMNMGAFLRNTIPGNDFDYGWGTYNMTTHQITGDSLFVVKTVGGAYKKFWIVNRNPLPGINSWNIKYADLDGSNEQDVTLSADDHSSKYMFHYSIDNNAVVDKEPAIEEWDLLFTRYFDYNIPYYVTGVLANSQRVSIQQVDGVDQATFENYTESEFNSNYSEIGSDWKTFNMGTFTYDVEAERVYFAKVYNADVTDSTYWKLYFTAFSGSSEGKYTFIQKNVTSANSIKEINGLELFEVYPNPANNYMTLVTDAIGNLEYRISDISGKQISNGNIEKGFSQQRINISDLRSGVYHISLISENGISTQTFIKQ